MQIADKYYLNYLAKFIADNRYYRDNFEKIIDYRDKKYCTDNGNPILLLNFSMNLSETFRIDVNIDFANTS